MLVSILLTIEAQGLGHHPCCRCHDAATQHQDHHGADDQQQQEAQITRLREAPFFTRLGELFATGFFSAFATSLIGSHDLLGYRLIQTVDELVGTFDLFL